VEFRRRELDTNGIVVDIGAASAALRGILATVEYRNLDELVEFNKAVTTTEYLARWVFLRMRAAVDGGKLGEDARGIDGMRVVLHESHVAWAAYEAPLKGAIGG
jgi:6-pyruvoyl-tetrahydropterin synthase